MAGETGRYVQRVRGRDGVGAGGSALFLSAAFVGLLHVDRAFAAPSRTESDPEASAPPTPPSRIPIHPTPERGGATDPGGAVGDAAQASDAAAPTAAGVALLPFAGGAVAPDVLLRLGVPPGADASPDGPRPAATDVPGPTAAAAPADGPTVPGLAKDAAGVVVVPSEGAAVDGGGDAAGSDASAGPVGTADAGTDGNDRLVGTGDVDALAGGDGDDVLLGAGGDDGLAGGAGDDVVDGGAGNDTLAGDRGADLLTGGEGADILAGGTGEDRLDGGPGDDLLRGGDDGDVLDGGPGADVLRGGSGDDAAAVDDLLDVVVEAGTESGGHDVVTVHPGFADRVAQLFGAQAPGGAVTFLLDDDLGAGRPGGVHGFTRRLPGVEELVIDDPAPHHAVGGSAAERLVGSDAANLLYGMGGNDTLEGQDGDDTLHGGAGDDVLHGGAGTDTLWGGEGDDLLDGGADGDLLYGGPGDDVYLLGLAEDGVDLIRDDAGQEILRVSGVATGELALRPEGEDLVLRHGDTLIARVLQAAAEPERFTVEGDAAASASGGTDGDAAASETDAAAGAGTPADALVSPLSGDGGADAATSASADVASGSDPSHGPPSTSSVAVSASTADTAAEAVGPAGPDPQAASGAAGEEGDPITSVPGTRDPSGPGAGDGNGDVSRGLPSDAAAPGGGDGAADGTVAAGSGRADGPVITGPLDRSAGDILADAGNVGTAEHGAGGFGRDDGSVDPADVPVRNDDAGPDTSVPGEPAAADDLLMGTVGSDAPGARAEPADGAASSLAGGNGGAEGYSGEGGVAADPPGTWTAGADGGHDLLAGMTDGGREDAGWSEASGTNATLSSTDVAMPEAAGPNALAGDAATDAGPGEGPGDLLAPYLDLPKVAGDEGDDILWAPRDGAARILGGEGNDALRGGPGDDLLDGGAGHDDLAGGAGADLLVGGDGNDLLAGGPGDDVAIVRLADTGTDILDDHEGSNRVVMPDAQPDLLAGFLVGDDLWVGADGDQALIVRGFAEHPASFAGIETPQGFVPADRLAAGGA